LRVEPCAEALIFGFAMFIIYILILQSIVFLRFMQKSGK
jgi:hypothetical protein